MEALRIDGFTAHVNNLYNTVFWALVQQDGQTTVQAHQTLKVGDLPSLQVAVLDVIYRALSPRRSTKYFSRASKSTTMSCLSVIEKEVFSFASRCVDYPNDVE